VLGDAQNNAMYVQRNSKSRTQIHCCGGKVLHIVMCACVRVGARERGRVQTQHATRMRHSVSGISWSTSFFDIIS
jgi:hypothetical protein